MYEGCEACAINLLIGDEWFPDQDVRLACLTAVSALLCLFVPSLWMSDPDQALLLAKGIFCCLE